MTERRTLIVEDHLPCQWRFGLVWHGLDEPGLWSTAALAWLTIGTVVFLKTAVKGIAGGIPAEAIALCFAILAVASLAHAGSRMRSTVAVELDHERLRVLNWSGRTDLSVERLAIRGVTLRPMGSKRYALALTLDSGSELPLPFAIGMDLGMAMGQQLWNALQELGTPAGYRH